MKRTDNALTLRLAATCTGAGLLPEQALELARNLAAVALLGPVTASEWSELVTDALDCRSRQRAGSAWLLAPSTAADLRVALQAAFA